jgi:hypothetical protein
LNFHNYIVDPGVCEICSFSEGSEKIRNRNGEMTLFLAFGRGMWYDKIVFINGFVAVGKGMAENC